MPKINSAQLKKGTRLAVQVNDEVFLSTITRVGKEKYYITFDDGDTGTVSRNSKRILGVAKDTKRKSAVPEARLSFYLVKDTKTPAANNSSSRNNNNSGSGNSSRNNSNSGNRLVRPRQTNRLQFTEEQLKYLKDYGWDMPSITKYLKLPPYRDLLAFYVSKVTSSYKDFEDMKQQMISYSDNPANNPLIEKMTTTQLKRLLTAFQELQLVTVEPDPFGHGFRVQATSKGKSRLMGLSWAKLYQYDSESESHRRAVMDSYGRPGYRYVGD